MHGKGTLEVNPVDRQRRAPEQLLPPREKQSRRRLILLITSGGSYVSGSDDCMVQGQYEAESCMAFILYEADLLL
jgi:hypothetical protein